MADSENRPWLRKVLVTLGPLAEWQNKSAGSTVQFASDGTMNGLRVSANIQKTLMGLPSPSTIKVYNLSDDTRNAVKKGLTKLTLQAGWENTNMATIYKGSIMNVQISDKERTSSRRSLFSLDLEPWLWEPPALLLALERLFQPPLVSLARISQESQ